MTAAKVYALEYSDYDEHWIAGIFARREDAEATLAAIEAVPFRTPEDRVIDSYRTRRVVVGDQRAWTGYFHDGDDPKPSGGFRIVEHPALDAPLPVKEEQP